MTVRRSVILGCGSYLPSQILTNADLARKVDTSDEWIVQRTGIHERHIAAPGETTSHLAVHAARAALNHAHVDAESIDLIVLATSTPDNTFPATAVAVQHGLGINHGAAFAALMARCEVNSPSAAICRSRMPVRCTIHSSEVSIRAASSALVKICCGR